MPRTIFTCNVCATEFDDEVVLETHMKNQHVRRTEITDPGETK